MAEGRIYVGSRARIELPPIDVRPEGETALDLTSLNITVWMPGGEEFPNPTVGEEDGVPYIDFAEGELSLPGRWQAQGDEDGYLSRPISWRVYRNPP